MVPPDERPALRDLIVSHAPVAVFLIDRDGRVLEATPPTRRLTRDGVVVGRHWAELVPEPVARAADLEAQLARARVTGREIALARVDAELDGAARSFRVTVVPVEDRLAVALLHVEDLSDTVATEARSRRAEAMARLREMSSAVAHELRNPLAAVTGALQVLARGLPEGDPRRPVMEKVEQQLYRLNALVSDLLAFAGPDPPRPERIDLSVVAGQAVDAARRVHPGAKFEPAGEGTAWADPGYVAQILAQVLENAAQAAPTGRVRVEVSPGTVAVHDSGPGVPATDRQRIFEPFFTTRTRGTGLGLPMGQRMALAMNGALTLDPSEGGARFVLRLPTDPDRGPSLPPLRR